MSQDDRRRQWRQRDAQADARIAQADREREEAQADLEARIEREATEWRASLTPEELAAYEVRMARLEAEAIEERRLDQERLDRRHAERRSPWSSFGT